ncbi:MAG: hypothetical protein AAFZ07_22100 [Actinomycetota bacterium]
MTVDLASGATATEHLHRALVVAQQRFPGELGSVDLGGADRFRRSYPDALPRFEAARVASDRRREIAEALVAAASSAVVWSDDAGECPLGQHLAVPAAPFDTTTEELPGDGRLRPSVPIDGDVMSGGDLIAAVRTLVGRGSATTQVADAIAWLVERAGSEGLDLGGERIVVLGAGAELAPTRLWLAGGADVLWIDVTDPSSDLLGDRRLSGRLTWIPGGADLLEAPERVLATIERFADGNPVDLGLYAYAGGRAREWRLTAAMNGVVDGLDRALVRSVAMLVSPTTCGVLSPEEVAGEHRRRSQRPRWQAALERVRALGDGPGHVEAGGPAVNRAVVSIQGASYQAAQYLGKLMAAEVWATGPDPVRVSAGTAGISRTESLQHPVFDLAFDGAAAFDVETFAPDLTAHLNGLLVLHDRLDVDHRLDVGTLFATRVHGGISELPHPIEPALRVAAAIGLLRKPSRVVSLIRRR